MLFNFATIQENFLNLVGWRQQQDPSALKLTALTTSDSSIYMQDVHPMLTLANLQSIAPDFSLYNYPAWNDANGYVVGDIVTLNNIQYRCIVANTNQTPPNANYWEVWNNNKAFTAWVQQRMEGACGVFLNDWIGRKFVNKSAENVKERGQLFTATGDGQFIDFGTGDKIVGHEFRVSRSTGLSSFFTRIGLHFDTSQDITLYLYKSGNRNAVQVQTFSYVDEGNVQWFDVEWELRGEGAYYLGYLTADVVGNAYDDSTEYTAWSGGQQLPNGCTYMKTHPFMANVASGGGIGSMAVEDTFIIGATDSFKPSDAQYNLASNGINVQFYVGCTYTDLVIEQRRNFATAYSIRLAIMLAEEIMNNPNARVNRNESNGTQAKMAYAIGNAQEGNEFSLSKRYEKALSAITLDTSSLDPICLPCAKKRKMKIGVI